MENKECENCKFYHPGKFIIENSYCSFFGRDILIDFTAGFGSLTVELNKFSDCPHYCQKVKENDNS